LSRRFIPAARPSSFQTTPADASRKVASLLDPVPGFTALQYVRQQCRDFIIAEVRLLGMVALLSGSPLD
jgi:hypothetical protein